MKVRRCEVSALEVGFREVPFTEVRPAEVRSARVHSVEVGCVIRLWPDDMVELGLVLGEGVETTLAAATRITASRHVSASGMGGGIIRQYGRLSDVGGRRDADSTRRP
jgi:hypothetical protein